MASLNVAEWSPDQVEEWLSGLGPTVARYAPGLRERGLDGNKLLMLRCDDLEYLGMHIIGHQELLLEAVEHLRNFQYEARRECVQQLAARVSAAATGLARALAPTDTRLDTQTLADVAATVRAVKPLVCWLDRWPVGARGLAERKAQLLQLSLEAATCAQRDRFAHQPARAVAAAAAAAAAAADYIVQEVADPQILVPASLDAVTLKQGGKPLGFEVVPSFCGHHQLADIRFGSPAHASGQVHEGDEIVQVGDRCVIGWSGAHVVAWCAARAASGELPLRLRRRAARPPPAAHPLRLRTRHRPPPPMHSYQYSIHPFVRTIHPAAKTLEPIRADDAREPSSSDSDALSPPASPHLPPHEPARLFGLPPAMALARRHTVAGARPAAKPTHHAIHQFWRQLREHRWERGGSPGPGDTLYRRDKAVSCSTGLELSPRPRTCTGVPNNSPLSPGPPHASPGPPRASPGPPPASPAPSPARGKLDKSHSTPAYDGAAEDAGALHTQVIPESPTPTPADSPTILVHSAEKADQILEFKKSSSQIGEAIELRRRADDDRGRVLEALNIAALQHRRRSILENERNKFFANDVVNIEDPVTSPTRLVRNTKEAPIAVVAPRAVAGGAGLGAGLETGKDVGSAAGRGALPVLRYVPRPPSPPAPRPSRHLDGSQISLPLRHITKHDIKVISERREMPPINQEAEPATPPAPAEPRPRRDPAPEPRPRRDPAPEDPKPVMLSPSAGVVKSIFPTSKSKSLKKKNSILAKRRCVAMRTLLASGGASTGATGANAIRAGVAWQRVRARHAQQPRWAQRHLLLAHRALYAYRDTECSKADCMINLEGFTVSAATEVKSRAHAFKVYHTGTAFYFAASSHADMLAWIHAVALATLHAQTQLDISQQFSETDYSDTESDSESSERRERERREEREKEKDKSKFGSLKKLTGRMQRSESSENVGHSTSLDRKYLRFFSRNKSKDDSKPAKVVGVGVVGTPAYRSYRRAAHASQPELAPRRAPPPAGSPAPITLEEFMLAEQQDTRRQMYTDRVVQGVEAGPRRDDAPHNMPSPVAQNRNLTAGERRLRTSSGNNGADKPSGADESSVDSPHERWRDSLRRNHKVHSAQSKPAPPAAPTGTSWGGGVSRLRLVFGAAPQYPHLQCPPTFQPESYSLARLAPARAPPPPP